jgi:ribosome-binding factor A
MPSKLRIARIADRIRNELSEMLIKELQDPRLSGVMVTDVSIDRELAYADIYVSAVEGQERAPEVLEGMRSASGFIRRILRNGSICAHFHACAFIGI